MCYEIWSTLFHVAFVLTNKYKTMMNEKLFTNKEIASQVGISEDELFQLARENGLFNEDGS